MSSFADSLARSLAKVTKPWAKIKKAEDRERRRQAAAWRERYREGRSPRVTIKEVAYEVMKEAYEKASGNGRYPANARQIMYAARPSILNKIDKRSFDDAYFTQKLLPDYMKENPEETADWDVVYDDRGHFSEPHTERTIGIGTVAVRDYLAGMGQPAIDLSLPEILDKVVDTKGWQGRYGGVLYVEKEGFLPLFEKVQIAERYDLAIASGKGLSTTAARALIETLSEQGVRIFVLHDFDKAGFSILGTLQRDTERYKFDCPPEIVDLGLRLEDVKKWGLQSEPCVLSKGAAYNLSENGATEDEIAFLCEGSQRVELNAFTSERFIEWLEGKLKAQRVRKVIADAATLQQAYRKAKMLRLYQEVLDQHDIEEEVQALSVPKTLGRRLAKYLQTHPELPWDKALQRLVEKEED